MILGLEKGGGGGGGGGEPKLEPVTATSYRILLLNAALIQKHPHAK